MAIATPGRHAAASDFLPDILARRGEVWVREASASMAPIIRPGDRLLLRPLAGPPEAGTVLAYRDRHRWVVHRLVARGAQALLVKGDDAESAEWIGAGDVLAQVVALRRRSGRTTRLDRWPWPWVQRLLALLSLRAGRRAGAGIARAAARLPFRVAGWMVR